MAGRIPQSFLDELLDRTDLVELVHAFVPLKRAGTEYKACCPFHDENTPSFYVSPKKQFYHCFGCGAHGTAFDFLMAHQNLAFPEAVQTLAERAGLEVPREDGSEAPQIKLKSPVREALEAANVFYREQLRQAPTAIAYLKQRGVSGVIARDFSLGWAPDGRDRLKRHLADAHRIEHLIEAGLLTEDGRRDRFFSRVMFPILDRRGRVIGFGGRRIDGAEPKYLNSPDGPLFHKGDVIYGLFEARRDERALDELVVVEGYMDVIALAQHGFHRAVACMGTALTETQLSTLFRQVDRVVLCFDGDAAGRRAARRSIDVALPLITGTRSLRVLLLDERDDPDSLVRREGLDAWQARLDMAKPLADTLLDLLAAEHDPGNADGRTRLAHAALEACAGVNDDVYRAQLLALIAERTQTPSATLDPLLERLRREREIRMARHRAAPQGATNRSDEPRSNSARKSGLAAASDPAFAALDRLLIAQSAAAADDPKDPLTDTTWTPDPRDNFARSSASSRHPSPTRGDNAKSAFSTPPPREGDDQDSKSITGNAHNESTGEACDFDWVVDHDEGIDASPPRQPALNEETHNQSPTVPAVVASSDPLATQRHQLWRGLFQRIVQAPETLQTLRQHPVTPLGADNAPPYSTADVVDSSRRDSNDRGQGCENNQDRRLGSDLEHGVSADASITLADHCAQRNSLADELTRFTSIDPGACQLLSQIIAATREDVAPRTAAQLLEALRGSSAHAPLAAALAASERSAITTDDDAVTRDRIVLDLARRLMRQLRLARMTQLARLRRPLEPHEREMLNALSRAIRSDDARPD
ncbi:MAG: DNA primase [Thioalkalivibrionaceae bacterium]